MSAFILSCSASNNFLSGRPTVAGSDVSFLSTVETGVVVPFVEGAFPLAGAPLAGACFVLGGII
jgi:hypothetical protein